MNNSEQGVRAPNTPIEPSKLRWNDLRIFMITARYTSLRAAAAAQRLSVNAVRAALQRLEEECGAALVRRSRAGIQLTGAGTRLLEQVRLMRAMEPDPAAPPPDRDILVQPGEIRIASSEALGSFWLTPRLAALASAIDDVRINLQLSYDLARDRSADHDVGLTYHLPADPDLIVARLATIHIMLFAAPAYLAARGTPTSFDDMREHRYIEQVSNGVNSALVDHLFGQHRPEGFVPICSNSAVAQFWAVESGVGIGAFPTYVTTLTDRIVPLPVPLQLRFELYYYYHAQAKRSPAVQSTIGWLKDCFDPVRYPWFSDRFVHPDAFPARSSEPSFGETFLSGLQRAAAL